jgi:predicted  nucleic acid-binding Zn-ribbon protein
MDTNLTQMIEYISATRPDSLLILDSAWHRIFGKHIKSVRISTLKKQMLELLKQRGRIQQRTKFLRERKAELLWKINKLTHSVFEKDIKNARTVMQKYQSAVLLASEELDTLNREEPYVEEQIRTINRHMLEETLVICYGKYQSAVTRIEGLNPLIAEQQKRLYDLLENRDESIKELRESYVVLHKMLGAGMIDKLDITKTKYTPVILPPIVRPSDKAVTYTLAPKSQA